MLAITLLKTLFHELDPDKITAVRVYDNQASSKYHELDLEVPGYPECKTLTAEARYGSHNSTMYYVHLNGDLNTDEDLQTPVVKAAIHHFFKTYHPDFFKEDFTEDISELSILDCFDITKIPDYRPKYAFPGIVMMEDIKNGTAKGPDRSAPSFPGLRMLMGGSAEEPEEGKPAFISKNQNLTEFKGEEDFNAKMEELKKQFNIDALLKK